MYKRRNSRGLNHEAYINLTKDVYYIIRRRSLHLYSFFVLFGKLMFNSTHFSVRGFSFPLFDNFNQSRLLQAGQDVDPSFRNNKNNVNKENQRD